MADDVQPITGTPAVAAARLCNFVTGKAILLPAHGTWLDKTVQPIVASNPGAWVDLIGHASRQWRSAQGDARHELNRDLSRQRCESAKQRISFYSPSIQFRVDRAEGDSQSLGASPDDGYDRAVEVYVYKSGMGPPRPNVPPVPATSFEIRVVGGFSGSALIQADDYIFQIVDLVRRQTAFYQYTGLGLGVSIPKVPGPGSVTKAGPPTKFQTGRPAQLYQFNSTASLFQDPGATGGDVSVGGTLRLTIKEAQDINGVIPIHPSTIAIDGGPGIQMPGLGSATDGVLALITQVFPFNGY